MLLSDFKNISYLKRSITNQPYGDSYTNSFGPVDVEALKKLYICQEGCSGCCGPKTTVTLTSKRLLSRRVEAGCCAKRYFDTALFLEKVEVMRKDSAQGRCDCFALLFACLSCTWPCLLCTMCCCCCCGDQPRRLELAVAHGYESFIIKKVDMGTAAIDITRAIMAAKDGR